MPFLSVEMCIDNGHLVSRTDMDTFVPIVKRTVPHPTILYKFHSYRFPGIIVDFIFMMDKFFRVSFPVTGEQDIFYTTFFYGAVRYDIPTGRGHHPDSKVQWVFKSDFIPGNFSNGVYLIYQHAPLIAKQSCPLRFEFQRFKIQAGIGFAPVPDHDILSNR